MRESEVKEKMDEEVTNKCDGNTDWCGFKKKLLNVASEVSGGGGGGGGGGIKIWICLCVERESYLGFGNSWAI